MAKIFLDVNILVDIVHRGIQYDIEVKHIYYISPLTIHVLIYLSRNKKKEFIKRIVSKLNIIDFTESIAIKALEGPVKDYEDNVQLHSATQKDCELFYTKDKELLHLGYFGAVKIIDPTVLS